MMNLFRHKKQPRDWVVLVNYGKGWSVAGLGRNTKKEAIARVQHMSGVRYAQYMAVQEDEARRMGISEADLQYRWNYQITYQGENGFDFIEIEAEDSIDAEKQFKALNLGEIVSVDFDWLQSSAAE